MQASLPLMAPWAAKRTHLGLSFSLSLGIHRTPCCCLPLLPILPPALGLGQVARLEIVSAVRLRRHLLQGEGKVCSWRRCLGSSREAKGNWPGRRPGPGALAGLAQQAQCCGGRTRVGPRRERRNAVRVVFNHMRSDKSYVWGSPVAADSCRQVGVRQQAQAVQHLPAQTQRPEQEVKAGGAGTAVVAGAAAGQLTPRALNRQLASPPPAPALPPLAALPLSRCSAAFASTSLFGAFRPGVRCRAEGQSRGVLLLQGALATAQGLVVCGLLPESAREEGLPSEGGCTEHTLASSISFKRGEGQASEGSGGYNSRHRHAAAEQGRPPWLRLPAAWFAAPWAGPPPTPAAPLRAGAPPS